MAGSRCIGGSGVWMPGLPGHRPLAHRAPGLEDWGASASLTWDPTPSSDQGLSMSLQQSVGASSSGGVNALLARETMAMPVAGAVTAGASRLEARAGYGLPLRLRLGR